LLKAGGNLQIRRYLSPPLRYRRYIGIRPGIRRRFAIVLGSPLELPIALPSLTALFPHKLRLYPPIGPRIALWLTLGVTLWVAILLGTIPL